MEIESKPDDEQNASLDKQLFPTGVVDAARDLDPNHELDSVEVISLIPLIPLVPLVPVDREKLQSDDDTSKARFEINGYENTSDENDDDLIYDDPFSQVKGSYSHLAALLRASGKLPQIDGELKQTASVLYILNEWFNSARPFIEPRRVSSRRNGSSGADSALRLEQLLDSSQSKFVTEDDQQIGKLWSAIASYSSKNGHGQYLIDTEPQLFTFLLTRILGTGRCHLQSKEMPPLKLAKPLPGKVIWQEIENHQRLAIVALEGEKEYTSLRWRYPWYVNRENWTCGPIDIDLSPSHIEAMFMASPVSKAEAPSLSLFFSEIGLDGIIPLPKVKRKPVVKFIFPEYTLTVETKAGLGSLNVEGAARSTPIDNLLINSVDPAETDEPTTDASSQLKVICVTSFLPELTEKPILEEDGTLIIERYAPRPPQLAPQFERMGFQEIAASVFGSSSQLERYFVPLKPDNWVDFVWVHIPRLRENGWHIADTVLEQFPYVEVDSKDIVLGFEYEDSNWWFTVSLTLELDGQKFLLYPILVQAIRSLPRAQRIDADLVESLNRNGKFVAMLPNKRIFAIPFDRLRPILISIAEMISLDPKLPKIRVSLLDAEQWLLILLIEEARWLGHARLQSLIECLKELCSVPRVKPPRKFGATLRPYQIDGLSWLQVQAKHGFGGILADDMGLGKTIQLLAHVCLEKQNKRLMAPFLVVCPTSVLPNWLTEAEKFCPHLKVVSYQGPERHAKRDDVKQADLVISTYPLIVRDLEYFQNHHWHGIALDESQAIKSSNSLISEVVGSLPANHRFCMTGTPIENHVHELWSQFRFLLPGLLGNEKLFDEQFTQPIELSGDKARAALLTRRIQPFVMRRTKAEVAAELPEKITIVQTVQLQGAQRDLYETVRLASTKKVREEIREKGFKQSKIMIFDVLLKLRQVCCDPRLVKLTAAKDVKESIKLEVLLDKLAELIAQGRKILLFSQFTSMLDLIAPELQNSGTTFVQLRGDTKDRLTPVNRFQSGEVPLFLISLKAGGTGLNLTAADTVIHYDPWWNPAVEEQATDRAHRIGQKKNVFVYKLIAEGTIEQRMLELQERKRMLANMILDGTGSPKMSFTEEELEYLLSPIGMSS